MCMSMMRAVAKEKNLTAALLYLHIYTTWFFYKIQVLQKTVEILISLGGNSMNVIAGSVPTSKNTS